MQWRSVHTCGKPTWATGRGAMHYFLSVYISNLNRFVWHSEKGHLLYCRLALLLISVDRPLLIQSAWLKETKLSQIGIGVAVYSCLVCQEAQLSVQRYQFFMIILINILLAALLSAQLRKNKPSFPIFPPHGSALNKSFDPQTVIDCEDTLQQKLLKIHWGWTAEFLGSQSQQLAVHCNSVIFWSWCQGRSNVSLWQHLDIFRCRWLSKNVHS